jgi:hypothetical protein
LTSWFVRHRRIDDPQDWVRRLITGALSYSLRVIPVLTGDVALPAEADLPPDIAALSRRQYVLLRRRYIRPDLAFLVDRIAEVDPELAEVATRRHLSPDPPMRFMPIRRGEDAGAA